MNEKLNITKFTEWNSLYEFQIPNVKLDEFFYNIKLAGPKYKKILVAVIRPKMNNLFSNN